MIKLDSNQVALTDPTNSYMDLKPAQRLIVLVPVNTEPNSATRRIWELANATGASVQFLGVCRDPAQEPSLRREMVTTALVLQAGQISAEVKVEIGTNWIDAVKTNYEKGDAIVCLADQRKAFLRRSLSQILASNFNTPIYIISGLYPQKSNRLSQVPVWLGFIGIMVSFGILHAQIVHLPEVRLQIVVLIFSIIPELWLLWVWNTLFS